MEDFWRAFGLQSTMEGQGSWAPLTAMIAIAVTAIYSDMGSSKKQPCTEKHCFSIFTSGLLPEVLLTLGDSLLLRSPFRETPRDALYS